MVSKPLERVPLNLPKVDPLKFDKADWIIVTQDNVDQVWADLKKKKFSVVIFGLTDKGYEDLSVSIAKIKKLVQQQRAVIAAYKNYYDQQNKAIDEHKEKTEDAEKGANKDKKTEGFSLKGLFK